TATAAAAKGRTILRERWVMTGPLGWARRVSARSVRLTHTQVIAEGCAAVFGAEEAAPLQLGHELVADQAQRVRVDRRSEDEPVARAGREPLLHNVGHLRRGADERRVADRRYDALVQLSDREVLRL